jgi:hypothetical protein
MFGSAGWHDMPLTGAGLTLLRQWVSTPASNHGLIVSNTTNLDNLYITSSEGATLSRRPYLSVTYTLP